MSPFECPHCHSPLFLDDPYTTKLEGGVAYAQTCRSCNHKVSIRPRMDTDPEVELLTERQIKGLHFIRYVLVDDIKNQIEFRNDVNYAPEDIDDEHNE